MDNTNLMRLKIRQALEIGQPFRPAYQDLKRVLIGLAALNGATLTGLIATAFWLHKHIH